VNGLTNLLGNPTSTENVRGEAYYACHTQLWRVVRRSCCCQAPIIMNHCQVVAAPVASIQGFHIAEEPIKRLAVSVCAVLRYPYLFFSFHFSHGFRFLIKTRSHAHHGHDHRSWPEEEWQEDECYEKTLRRLTCSS
jgi:hypothetical protein